LIQEVVKEQTKDLFGHDASWQTITKGTSDVNVAQILHGAAEDFLSHIHFCGHWCTSASLGIYKLKKLVKMVKKVKMKKLITLKSAIVYP
jgi:hypothetical protein